jgi:hypothetical protein
MSDGLEEDDFESLENDFELLDENEAQEKEVQELPKRGSVEWNDYVMSQFTSEELYNDKYPTLNGMRRVALLLLGEPIVSAPKDLKASLDHTSNGRAYCVYELAYFNGNYTRVYSGAADSFEGNTDKNYAIYPVCIAESRAEARAYRKALLLTTVTAEEIKGNEQVFESVITTKSEYNEKLPISDTQTKIIDTFIKKLNINKDKTLELLANKLETKEDAVELIKKLNEYQADKSLIPKEILNA